MGPITGFGSFFDAGDKAQCAQPMVDPEWFFDDSQTDMAKIICDQCPLKQACGQWAIETNENFGVYGGLTPDERRKIIKNKVSLNQRKAK
jgi:WhiB family redox-sensing transcriptional regulator